MDALLDLFAKGVATVVVFLIAAALCILVCGIALSPVIGVLYLIADWYDKRRLKRLSSDVQRALQAETEVSSKECSKVHCN